MTISTDLPDHAEPNWDVPLNAKLLELVNAANDVKYAVEVTPVNGGTYSMTGDEYAVVFKVGVASYTIEFPDAPEEGQFVRLVFWGAIPALTLTHDASDLTPDLASVGSSVSAFVWVFADDEWVGVTNPTVAIDDGAVETDSVWSSDRIVAVIGATVAPLAPLASPALTGTPTAPTPAAADNDTSIATTAFVQGEKKATIVTPTNGGTYNITGLESVIMFNNPATVAAYTIAFPASPVAGQQVVLQFANPITALTITHSALVMQPQPTTIPIGQFFDWTFVNLSGVGDVWLGRNQPASASAAGYAEAATSAETITGTDAARYVTPAGLTAKIDDLGWIAATLGNSWTNAVTVGYRKANGRVSLRGRATGGTTNTMFTLPAGYRPATALTIGVLSGASGSTMCTITISTGGAVAATSGTVPNLDGVEFFNS